MIGNEWNSEIHKLWRWISKWSRLVMKSVRISLIRNSEVEGHVAALDSKLFNGFFLVARYTKTLSFGQDDCQMSIHSYRIFSARKWTWKIGSGLGK